MWWYNFLSKSNNYINVFIGISICWSVFCPLLLDSPLSLRLWSWSRSWMKRRRRWHTEDLWVRRGTPRSGSPVPQRDTPWADTALQSRVSYSTPSSLSWSQPLRMLPSRCVCVKKQGSHTELPVYSVQPCSFRWDCQPLVCLWWGEKILETSFNPMQHNPHHYSFHSVHGAKSIPFWHSFKKHRGLFSVF